MSDNVENPVDVFDDLGIAEFKHKPFAEAPPSLEKEKVRQIAEQSDFSSRQPVKIKPKSTTKTYSLFEEDLHIITNAMKACFNAPDPTLSQPSGSDVIRAALKNFARLSPDEQVYFIKESRGRGRK